LSLLSHEKIPFWPHPPCPALNFQTTLRVTGNFFSVGSFPPPPTTTRTFFSRGFFDYSLRGAESPLFPPLHGSFPPAPRPVPPLPLYGAAPPPFFYRIFSPPRIKNPPPLDLGNPAISLAIFPFPPPPVPLQRFILKKNNLFFPLGSDPLLLLPFSVEDLSLPALFPPFLFFPQLQTGV